MKKKRVGALVMSVMLVLGMVTPVMATDARTKKVLMAVEGETEPGTLKTPKAGPGDVSSLVSEEALRRMSANLAALADQVLANYNAMTQEEKDAIEKVNGQALDIPTAVQSVKTSINFETLKTMISGMSAVEADAYLTTLDESSIGYFDGLNAVIRQAKDFASNYDQYLQSEITTAIKLLQDLLVKDRLLYTEDYLAQAKTYYDEAVTLKPGVQTNQDIIDFCDNVNAFYQTKGKHLNTGLLDEGMRAANAFPAFLRSAPNPTIQDRAFNYGGATPLTYENITGYVIASADRLKNSAESGKLTYDDLSYYSTVLYGNLLEAYNGVSTAILTDVSKQVADAEYIGYDGDEKAAYEAALKAYQEAFAAKNYAGLVDLVNALRSAADEYAIAAKNHAQAKGKAQIAELKKKLAAIKDDIEKHADYYNDTYLAEVLNAIRMLNEANLDTVSGREIMALVNHAQAVVDKQASSYSSKLQQSANEATGLVSAANEWWSFVPEAIKGQGPYVEAIRLTNNLSGGLGDIQSFVAVPRTVGRNDDASRIDRSSMSAASNSVNHGAVHRSRTVSAINQINTGNLSRSSVSAASNNVYLLDPFVRSYDTFSADLKQPHGKIQSAAKAAAQYVYDSAEKVYRTEAKKTHTADLLREFRTAIDNLKASIKAWDYEETRAYAAAVKAAEAKLLQERQAAPNTGDDAGLAGLVLLGLLSLTSFAGFFKLRRKIG